MTYSSPMYSPPLWLDVEAFLHFYEQETAPLGPLNLASKSNLCRFLRGICEDSRIKDVRYLAYILATTVHECRSASTGWKTTWSPVSETKPKSGGGSYFSPVVVRDWDGNPLGSNGMKLEPLRGTDGKTLIGKRKPSSVSDEELAQFFPAESFMKRSYYGRGYVQITHQDNYRAMDEVLGLRGALHLDPELALVHEHALEIAVHGMLKGSFRRAKRVQNMGFSGGYRLGDFIDTTADYKGARETINSPTDHATTIAGYAKTFERIIQQSRLR